ADVFIQGGLDDLIQGGLNVGDQGGGRRAPANRRRCQTIESEPESAPGNGAAKGDGLDRRGRGKNSGRRGSDREGGADAGKVGAVRGHRRLWPGELEGYRDRIGASRSDYGTALNQHYLGAWLGRAADRGVVIGIRPCLDLQRWRCRRRRIQGEGRHV